MVTQMMNFMTFVVLWLIIPWPPCMIQKSEKKCGKSQHYKEWNLTFKSWSCNRNISKENQYN